MSRSGDDRRDSSGEGWLGDLIRGMPVEDLLFHDFAPNLALLMEGAPYEAEV